MHAMFEGSTDEITVNISRDFGLIDSDLELSKDSLIINWAGEFADAGFEVKKAILKRYVQDMRVVADESGDENKTKQELIDGIENATQPQRRDFSNSIDTNPTRQSIVDQFNNAQANNAGTA